MIKQIKQNKLYIKYNTRLIILLFIWCITLTIFTGCKYHQQQQEIINTTIINQESIPLENISIDEFEVIGD